MPTTEGVTTHSQLAAAIANTDDAVVVVEGDVAFPALSVIPVFSGRSVSVVGRSAVNGGRVVFNGAGHSQHFWVNGEGSVLRIAFVNLVNGTASEIDSNCRPDLYKCAGGSILVEAGGTLVMRSCDITGGSAFYAAGVYVHGDYSAGEFYNCSFTDLNGKFTTALYAQGSTAEESGITIRLAGCQFLRNVAVACIVAIGWDYVRAEIYDCTFANNDGPTLVMWYNADSQIVRCVFRDNIGTGNSFPGYGSAVVIQPLANAVVSISDTIFTGNIGDVAFSGGALTLAQGVVLMENVSFLANTAQGFDGGAAFEVQGAKVTATNCFARANVGNQFGGGFFVGSGELTLINSTCQRFGAG